MIPMITEPGVDRSLPEWDTGLVNFGYMADPRFPKVQLLARTLKRAKAEALEYWHQLKASTDAKPEGFMLVAPGMMVRHYIDDAEYSGWSFRERDKREELEFTAVSFHIGLTGKEPQTYLMPMAPGGIHPSELGLNPDVDELSGTYMLEIRDERGIAFTSPVYVTWGAPDTNPKAMIGDDLVMKLRFEETGRVLKELQQLEGRWITLRFDYQGL